MDSWLPVRKCQPGSVAGRAKRDSASCFLLQGFIWRVDRIKAEEHHVVIGSRIEGDHLQRADEGLFHLVAQHRAVEIDER